MAITFQAGRPLVRGRRGLSGAPVTTEGTSSSGQTIYLDANGNRVLSDGSLFTGIFTLDSNKGVYQVTSGRIVAVVTAPPDGSGISLLASSWSQPTSGKKCCNCVATDINENWYLASSRRTAQDVPVTIVRRKTVCTDPNSSVKINCSQVQAAAGLQGLGSLGCNCQSRM